MRRGGAAVVVAAAALALAAAPARAGTYEVRVCGSVAGAAQNAFVAVAEPMMSAYSLCPPSSGVGTGVVTKATSNGGRAPHGAGAYQIFHAPPGTQLGNVTFNVGAIRLSSEWSVGVVAYDHDFNSADYPYGCYTWTSYCGIGTPVFSIAATVNLMSHTRFRFETRCGNPVGCDTSASPFNPANRALFSAANVVVRVVDYTPPSVAPHHGALWNGGWHRGREEAWTSYTDGAGVMVTRLYVDGRLHSSQDYRDGSWPDWVRCDFTRARPCVDVVPGGFAFDTTELADGAHRIDVEAVDAGDNATSTGHTIHVDNSVPAKPQNVTVAGGEGWRGTNRFDLDWTNPGGQVSPLVRARYRLCLAGGSECAEGSAAGDGISGLRDLRVPGPGEWVARVWLEDAAGNHDAARGADPVRLRFDDEAPSVVWGEQDPNHPRTLRAVVRDAGSGVASGTIEVRRLAGGGWIDAGGRLEAGHLVARIDDLSLPDGIYEVRAQARDVAGNERTGTRRADGSPMRIALPLRASARLARVAAGGCRKRRCRPPRSIRNGARIRAYLTVGGRPVPRAPVDVLSRVRTGGSFERVASLRTDAGGGVAFRARSGPSRTLRLGWAGTETVKPVHLDVPVRVPARSALRVDRRHVRNGEAVTFTGRLLGRPLPDGGKLIDLQVQLRGRWRTFATPRTDAAGRWSYVYRFEATRGFVAYRFRARIRREAAYPYELGHSRTLRVTVRG